MNNTTSKTYRTRGRKTKRGSAYIEYFVAAAAMAGAAMWLYQGGNFQGVRGTLKGAFDWQMGSIAGPVGP
jgi:hypothetical protein